MSKPTDALDPEIAAIANVYSSLKEIDASSQQRVLDYVARKLGLQLFSPSQQAEPEHTTAREDEAITNPARHDAEKDQDIQENDEDDSLEGISTVARKWMRRNGLTANGLSTLFSLGIEDIDLVAKTVPGDTKKDRMKSVFLLMGVAAYLGSGVARFKHDKVKEACLHYDAFDSPNFARYLRDFNSEISGSKDNDYTLTARGLSSATELIRETILGKKNT